MNKSIIFASAIALLCSACEMKDELWSKNTDHNSHGVLNLNVNATQPESMTRASISTDDFEVDIVGKGNLSDRSYSYTYGSMPNSITLPVGDFTLTAHTPGDLEKQMDHAYYRGTADVTIEENMTSKKEVSCTMANSRISISYSESFFSVFESWTITIDDGRGHVLDFDSKDKNPADVFWFFEKDVSSITVNITGKTQNGNDIVESSTYTKKNCEETYEDIENENFTGGDAITINFSPVEDEKTGSITGIDIQATVTFDNNNHDDTITLHIKDTDDENNTGGNDPSTPDTPDTPDTPTDPITISEPNGTSYLVNGVVYTQDYDETDDDEFGMHIYRNYPTDVALHFEVPNGLQNLYVLISGTDEFNFMTGLVGLTAEPYGLDLTDTTDSNTAEITDMNLFTMPTVGMTQYDFAFSDGIWSLLPAFVGKQSFKLRAVDSKGNILEKTLVVTIFEKQ